ncbi:hypothetical protein Moror_13521 [Moniliophthora roreri MCA 2997]|uniref:Uncharacterized protein n=1 Tax=Moniliophthora roreri (strain MCA 2997) TaxID=1381753 RepID=V2WAK6_MONRO|nr:hypothetical protein Moror_13521 [Moniliophthora roreri MCA 2997]
MAVQFSQAYDVYTEVKHCIKKRVLDVLDRSRPHWRMLNCCPPYQYEVWDKLKLPIQMLICGDSNDTMKRVEARGAPETDAEGNKVALGMLKECLDPRDGGEDYFLSQVEVDKWGEKRWTWKDGERLMTNDSDNPCDDK